MTFFNWLRGTQFSIISFKKLIAQITIRMIGEANESTKLFSVAVLAKKTKTKTNKKIQVLSYCLTTTYLLIFREHIYCDLIQIFFSV